MKWILVTILVFSQEEVTTVYSDPFPNMDSCFNERDSIIESFGRPIINYQAICVPYVKDYKPGNNNGERKTIN